MRKRSFFPISLSPLILIIFLSCLPISTPSSITPTQIQDLVTTTSSGFSSEAGAWTASNLVGSVAYTLCGTNYILGGPNVLGTSSTSYNHYFQRSYSGITTNHNMIYYSMTFYALDAWSKTNFDTFQLQFDSRLVSGWEFDVSTFTQSLCSGSGGGNDMSMTIYGRVYHTGSTLTFKIISKLGQKSDTESFGIRNLNLLFVQTLNTTTTEDIEGRAPITLYTNAKGCATGQYQLFASTQCGTCHANCQECFGPNEKDCYICASGKTWNGYACITSCNSACATCFGDTAQKCLTCTTGYYLANNNTCVTPCNSPLVITSNGVINFCETRCTAQQYAYPNGSCIATCPYPLQASQVATFNLCTNPCPSQYLHWDQTCKPNCNTPWKIRSTPGVNYCEFPCLINQVAFWNGTCASDCPFPLKLVYESATSPYKFCESPCTSTQYVYADGTCQSNCPFPLTKKVESGVQYCKFGCPSSRFLYWNGSCLSTCPSPFKIQGTSLGNYCEPPCSSPQYFVTATQECLAECDGITQTDSLGLYMECLPADAGKAGFFENVFLQATAAPGKLSFLGVAKSLDYIRYFDIDASPRLLKFMKNQGRPLLSLRYGYRMPETMQEEFTKQPLPSVYERIGLHSSFLVNFWMEITSYGIMIGVMILFMALEIIFDRLGWTTLEGIFRALKIVVKWNFFLILIATGLDNIILFSILEFTTFQFDTFVSGLSLIICIFIIGAAIAFLLNIVYILPLFKEARGSAAVNGSYDKYLRFLMEWDGFQVLFRGFKDDEFFKEYFFLLYVIRLAFPMVISWAISGIPLLQAIIYLLISITILFYIFKIRPLKKRINNIQLIIFESIVLVINFNLIILAILDLAGVSATGAGVVFGDFVIFGDLCINLLAVVFLAIKVVTGLKTAEELHAKIPEMGKAALVQLIYLPIQQGGMGFEQVQLANFHNQRVIPKPVKLNLQQAREKYLTSEDFEKMDVPEKRRLVGLISKEAAKSGEPNFEEVENEIEIFQDPKKE